MSVDFQKIHKKMTSQDKLYGTTTLGSRGQLVIPAQARKDLRLKPGDQLLVMGKYGKALGLIKAEQLQELVDVIMKNLSGSGAEKLAKKHLAAIFSGQEANN
ncbi:MAG: AbrB/MazE/SpoVT family DNA-binding domain-containing protein [Patescibacteria group bacterium]|nr:AbrB/MazE/SpoVT family DNA-binding domain-containing protein [Patescibacteria group bacterium]